MTALALPDHFLGINDVMQATAIRSKTTIYALMNEGKFPKSYAVTDARVAWSAREVSEWIEARKNVGANVS